ncbi:MAG: cobalamin-independent methionine synthase II family protein [Acidobacteriia bacterium]|nr:cobalamin-independent methionine synthase II family protein [Terriglobia bacterium]MBV8902468.1 cobalamin-independent methionine synthase II family protein [Terriglobia bacterium]
MKLSTDRILTTHCGSLPRPHDLLDMMKVKLSGAPYDHGAYTARVQRAVADIVERQVDSGIDMPSDGEMSKPGFFAYVRERLDGFEPKPDFHFPRFAAETEAFPEYYADYMKQAMLGGAVAAIAPLVCTGPVSYRTLEFVRRDIANLKAALQGREVADAFLPSVAPSGVGFNRYYKTEEEYFHAVGEAMRQEYLAIVEAGFLLQLDDPFLTEIFSSPSLSQAERKKTAEMWVNALNHAIRGIAPEKIRFHTCYGINEGPRVFDAPLRDVAEVMIRIDAGAYSFENANARHEHEYHIWESIKLPEGKALIPGVITHASNIVEHPELIAERIVRFARLVGRENVIAGADCGFSSQATYRPEIHPTVMWAKFRALAEGARLATKQL